MYSAHDNASSRCRSRGLLATLLADRNGLGLGGNSPTVLTRVVGLHLIQVWVGHLIAIAEPCWDNRYEFRQFDLDELSRLAADPVNDLAPDVVLQLADAGHRCFGTMDGPNLACYVWLARRNISTEHTLDVPLSLPADACYLFKAFTVPAYRGRGSTTLRPDEPDRACHRGRRGGLP